MPEVEDSSNSMSMQETSTDVSFGDLTIDDDYDNAD